MARDRAGRNRHTQRSPDGRLRNVWAAETRPEAEPIVLSQTGHQTNQDAEHSLAHLGIITITTDDGVLVARNTVGGTVVCPHCRGDDGEPDLTRQAVCVPCSGRGVVSDVPFCDRQWDCIDVNEKGGRLYLGGHDCQPGGGDCQPGSRFDLVVSLYTRPGFEPGDGTKHLTHVMVDGPLDPADHEILDDFSDEVVAAYERGERVLVRCQAGMNRSGLVLGLAMVKMGWSTDEAIDRMRAERTPFVLFNDDFVAHVRAEEDRRRLRPQGAGKPAAQEQA